MVKWLPRFILLMLLVVLAGVLGIGITLGDTTRSLGAVASAHSLPDSGQYVSRANFVDLRLYESRFPQQVLVLPNIPLFGDHVLSLGSKAISTVWLSSVSIYRAGNSQRSKTLPDEIPIAFCITIALYLLYLMTTTGPQFWSVRQEPPLRGNSCRPFPIDDGKNKYIINAGHKWYPQLGPITLLGAGTDKAWKALPNVAKELGFQFARGRLIDRWCWTSSVKSLRMFSFTTLSMSLLM
jgi:hypothetical protein